MIDLQLRGYNGRNSAQCSPDHLGVLAKLCPRVEKMHLGLTWPESFLFLSRFRNISHLSVFRVASVENFDLPLMVSYDNMTMSYYDMDGHGWMQICMYIHKKLIH